VLAVCAAVVLLLNYKGVRRQLPVDYHLPAHDNQSLSLWRQEVTPVHFSAQPELFLTQNAP
jgi:hypothetical protein